MYVTTGSRAVQRLRREYTKLNEDPIPYVTARPIPADILEWHFVVRGPEKTPLEGGVYHGKLRFPQDFPFSPPSIYIMTPNGRFECNKRLCLSISDFHPETWNPSWSMASILTGLLSFMLDSAPTSGSLDTTDEQKQKLAKESLRFNLQLVRCPEPGIFAEPLPANMLEWRFVPSGPPEIQMLTPSGRFKTNTPICLLHLKRFTWDPSWSLASVLSAFREFMVHGDLTQGSVWFTTDRHKRCLAEDSLRFNLQDPIFCELFPDLSGSCRRRMEERWTKEVEATRSTRKGDVTDDEKIRCDDTGMVVFMFVFFVMAGITGVVTLVCLMK